MKLKLNKIKANRIVAAASAGQSFPGGITPFIWLKAESLSALSQDDPVATWPDSSGNGNDFTQSTSGNRPLKKNSVTGLAFPCVKFDGTDDSLIFDSTTQYRTVIAVINSGTLAEFKGFFGARSASPGNWEAGLLGTGSNRLRSLFRFGTNNGANFASTGEPSNILADDTSYIISAKVEVTGGSTTVRIWVNGVANGNGTDANDAVVPDRYAVGAAFFGGSLTDNWPASIAEILVYENELSDVQREAVEDALSTKFGI